MKSVNFFVLFCLFVAFWYASDTATAVAGVGLAVLALLSFNSVFEFCAFCFFPRHVLTHLASTVCDLYLCRINEQNNEN